MADTPIENRSDTFDIGGDLTVKRLGFGAMRITGEDIIGPPESEAEAKRVLRRAVELGVDFIDTADSYGPGVSESLIGEELDPDEAVVGTKGGLLRTPDGEWHRHGDPTYLWNAHLCSHDRLDTGTIDLYQLHRIDEDTPLEDSVHALAEMKEEGYVNHLGLSNVTVEQLDEAREIVDIATVQNEYNVATRPDADEAVLEVCERDGIGFIPWFPLGGGDLDEAARETLDAVADEQDATAPQVSIAWLLQRSPVMLPIPGTGSVDHLEENVAASALELTDDQVARLDAVVE
jgi:aryl-alcohol dehydrogenase-like predicted oxidoreductase